MNHIRSAILGLTLISACAGAADYPLWNRSEPVSAYAARTRLSPTLKLDAGSGISIDAMLIPAGRFQMGALPPPRPREATLELCVFAIGGVVTLLIIGLAFVRVATGRKRLRFSLSGLLLLTFLISVTLGASVQLWKSNREWKAYGDAVFEYENAPAYEKPPHDITISKPFYMGKTEVTQAQYRQIMGMGANRFAFNGEDLPADSMTWEHACEFCRRLSQLTGRRVRLPTEAEWEFACRAGSESACYLGDRFGERVRAAWCGKHNPQSVAMLEPNDFGLHDTLGNVWEWCHDWYGDSYYSTSPAIDPQGADNGDYHAIRGGSWLNSHFDASSFSRWDSAFGATSRDVGFRIAIDAEPAPGTDAKTQNP